MTGPVSARRSSLEVPIQGVTHTGTSLMTNTSSVATPINVYMVVSPGSPRIIEFPVRPTIGDVVVDTDGTREKKWKIVDLHWVMVGTPGTQQTGQQANLHGRMDELR